MKEQSLQIISSMLMLLASVTLLPSANAAPTGREGPLIIGYTFIPPYVYKKDGKLTGAMTELTEKTMAQLPYSYVMKQFPIKRLSQNVIIGKVDIWVRVRGEAAFSQSTLSGQVPVINMKVNLYSLAPLEQWDWSNITGPVITVHGYKYNGYRTKFEQVNKASHFIEAPSHLLAFKLLLAKRAPYLLNYELPSLRAMKKLGITAISSINVGKSSVYFHVSKRTEKAQKLIQELDEAYIKAFPRQAGQARVQ
ncbi:MAG: hypothetical protein JKY57_04530 [Kordiimonadaceae bacterium]|nr:hypothetical protein [Kordiimonadaceae bacterium]